MSVACEVVGCLLFKVSSHLPGFKFHRALHPIFMPTANKISNHNDAVLQLSETIHPYG
jgi:hypothetical protein